MDYSTVLITAPTLEVVSLAEAKAQCRIDSSDEDTLIGALRDAAVAHVDAAGEGWLNRALAPQTWEYRASGFPCEIRLPFPPLLSVTSIKYDDGDGVEQTLVANTDYKVFGVNPLGYGLAVPAFSRSWPAARAARESVRVQYQAGYAAAAVPKAVKQAILLMIGDFYEFRESVVVGTISAKIPMSTTVENLLSLHKAYWP